MAKRNALIIALLLSVTSASVWAEPSLHGTSGGLSVPTTDIIPTASLAASTSAVWIDRQGETKDNLWYSLNYGLLPRVEAGFSYVSYRSRRAQDLLFHCKWQALPQAGLRPAVAFGAVDVVGELTDDPSAYVVIGGVVWAPKDPFSGEPTTPLRAHLGIGTGIYGDAPFAALDWSIHPRIKLLVEWQKNLSLGTGQYLYNVGAQFTVGSGFTLDAGALDMRYPSVGISYRADNLGF
ncbi:MAG: YjbH domain-containing protein [Armatimonadetes bacterium]|jgi:hypothetical protein|nr:YjbH domain-containing protein [Armatimonadota bacterium]